MKPRGYYFGAGPACFPEEILKQAQTDLWNWQGSGLSILELGFRTTAFMELKAETEALLRMILSIPAEFEVLFFASPARSHFAYIPLNLLTNFGKAAYIISGTWSDLAYREAYRLLPEQIYLLESNVETEYLSAPQKQVATNTQDFEYLYYCSNETIAGFAYQPTGIAAAVPRVVDMTSSILTEAIDFDTCALVYAGAQKNIANAGLSIIVVRKDYLSSKAARVLPLMDDYRCYAQEGSLYATPPTFNIYLMNLMMKWVLSMGGLPYFQELSLAKSGLLYDYLDHSQHFKTYVAPPYRSHVNVAFTTGDSAQDLELLRQAEAAGLYGLKGHRRLGGLRASLYNAMPLSGVETLIKFLDQFV